jgi:hypothetical protein
LLLDLLRELLRGGVVQRSVRSYPVVLGDPPAFREMVASFKKAHMVAEINAREEQRKSGKAPR